MEKDLNFEKPLSIGSWCVKILKIQRKQCTWFYFHKKRLNWLLNISGTFIWCFWRLNFYQLFTLYYLLKSTETGEVYVFYNERSISKKKKEMHCLLLIKINSIMIIFSLILKLSVKKYLKRLIILLTDLILLFPFFSSFKRVKTCFPKFKGIMTLFWCYYCTLTSKRLNLNYNFSLENFLIFEWDITTILNVNDSY